MNAGLDADQPTRAMTPEQREQAAAKWLHDHILNVRRGPFDSYWRDLARDLLAALPDTNPPEQPVPANAKHLDPPNSDSESRHNVTYLGEDLWAEARSDYTGRVESRFDAAYYEGRRGAFASAALRLSDALPPEVWQAVRTARAKLRLTLDNAPHYVGREQDVAHEAALTTLLARLCPDREGRS